MTAVFLVEGEQTIRAGLRMWLELAPDLRVVGEAATGSQARQALSAAKPDVAVVDMQLPDTAGEVLIQHLRREVPGTAVVALSLHDSAALRRHALAAGACVFVAMHEPNETLLDAIRRASSWVK